MGEHNKRGGQRDISSYEATCFDEIRMRGPNCLSNIFNFMNNRAENICNWCYSSHTSSGFLCLL